MRAFFAHRPRVWRSRSLRRCLLLVLFLVLLIVPVTRTSVFAQSEGNKAVIESLEAQAQALENSGQAEAAAGVRAQIQALRAQDAGSAGGGGGASVTSDTGGPSLIDKAALLIAAIMMYIAQVLGQGIVLILDGVVLTLMQYNGFAASPVVEAGWTIIRDTVNMFFVIVLIIIAFGTIFGQSRFAWQQQVPRLMLFAIVINFSRTLCGIMIDFSQVVMLTFANALKDIAGGNFIQLFGLGDILSITSSSALIDGLFDNTTTLQAFDWFAASIMAVLMMTIVLSTVIILASILVWRIVALWVLIVISPLAWFVGGARGIVKSGAYEQWWEQFTCAVAIGPILIFFLWLTLAVAGSGNIAVSDPGFLDQAVANEVGSSSQLLLKIFETHRFISFVIGIAMLFAGFQAAKSICSGAAGGFVQSALGKAEGFAKSALKAPVTAPAAAARFTGRTAWSGAKGVGNLGLGAAKFTGKWGGKAGLAFGKWGVQKGYAVGRKAASAAVPYVAPAVSSAVGSGLATLLAGKNPSGEKEKALKAAFEQSPEKGAAELIRQKAEKFSGRNTATGRAVAGVLNRKASGLDAQHAAKVQEAGKDYKDAGREAKVSRLNEIASHPEDKTALASHTQNQAVALLGQALGDKKAIGDLESAGTLDHLIKTYGDKVKDTFGEDVLTNLKETRPHVTGDVSKIQDLEGVRKLSESALQNTEVRAHLDQLTIDKIKKGKDGEPDRPYTAGEYIREGLLGGKKRSLIQDDTKTISGYDHKEAKFNSTFAQEQFRKELIDDPTLVTNLKIKDLEPRDAEGNVRENAGIRKEVRSVASSQSNIDALAQKYHDAIQAGDKALETKLRRTLDAFEDVLTSEGGTTTPVASRLKTLRQVAENAGEERAPGSPAVSLDAAALNQVQQREAWASPLQDIVNGYAKQIEQLNAQRSAAPEPDRARFDGAIADLNKEWTKAVENVQSLNEEIAQLREIASGIGDVPAPPTSTT